MIEIRKNFGKKQEIDIMHKRKKKGVRIYMESSKLLLGDSLEELKEIADCTVDLLCTDPPYG